MAFCQFEFLAYPSSALLWRVIYGTFQEPVHNAQLDGSYHGGFGTEISVYFARNMNTGGLALNVSVDVSNILRKIKIDLRYAIRGAAEVHHFSGS